ncbi:hypothetical protein [Polyangium aurulentum]|uniref:hypothetical protein n=1 Tax=Polyangium aurulentum TaxID=2567896 RepID=UPI0010ADE4BB|nr:hypothetical protein [Polyangium aurulentum]UQA58514.1 hypothetical protein E8A73_045970 [Polyangium aurulentum]
MYHRKNVERKERHILRLAREDAAGKLLSRAPDLADLHMKIDETQRGGSVGDRRYIRRVVLAQAPALFEVPCSDPQCENGGYDVTDEILSALASRRTLFEGQQSCSGRCGANTCGRVFHYVATATYRTEQSAEPG